MLECYFPKMRKNQHLRRGSLLCRCLKNCEVQCPRLSCHWVCATVANSYCLKVWSPKSQSCAARDCFSALWSTHRCRPVNCIGFAHISKVASVHG